MLENVLVKAFAKRIMNNARKTRVFAPFQSVCPSRATVAAVLVVEVRRANSLQTVISHYRSARQGN